MQKSDKPGGEGESFSKGENGTNENCAQPRPKAIVKVNEGDAWFVQSAEHKGNLLK